MVCIYCGFETQVINSRPQKRTNSIWRRRRCVGCTAVFTSVETPDFSAAFRFQTQTGDLEPFSRDALLLSLHDSLKHRKSALSDATALTGTIIGRLPSIAAGGIVTRDGLVRITSSLLKNFDSAAVVHYTAFHPLPTS